MKIRPRNIPKYLLGNTIGLGVSDWTRYLGLYNSLYNDNARILGNTPLLLRKDFWKGGNGYDTHHLRDNLESAAWSNYNYTLDSNKSNIGSDILYYADNSGKTYKDGQDFVNLYNNNIDYIFDTLNQHYDYNMNDKSWADFNRNYNLTYHSKGSGDSPATILYDSSNELYRGTSTHARRPDWYEKTFDELPETEKQNRIHTVTINGKLYKVAKEHNGYLRLLPELTPNAAPSQQVVSPSTEEEKPKAGSILEHHNPDSKPWYTGLISGIQLLGPNLLEDIRLGLSLNANLRIYDATLKGIRPNLLLTYNTHRQVVGDEATKLAYYRRAAQGQTQAAKAFTSDADRQMAYQMEAKRIGDELRAQGDLADNQEIRRTSDESNQHLWANTQRATEVANQNVAQINAANLAKLNLLAEKYAADHSSWDNFLKGREYRWRQRNEEDLAYAKQDLMLLHLYDLLNDSEITTALKKLNDLLESTKKPDGTYNYNDERVKAASIELLRILLRKSRELYNKIRGLKSNFGVTFAKTGVKITRRKKDDLLYKSARDVVEHFRRMTKLTDDSYLKSRKKVPKLTPHPTKKMLQGGVAPFTVFTPVGLGGETSTLVSQLAGSGSKSSSSAEKEGKETLDLIKKLFELISAKGLPVDVSSIYTDMSNLMARAEAFGRDLSTQEIATMYLNSMRLLNAVSYNAKAFEQAKQNAINAGALNEIAVDTYGRVAFLNRENGNVEYINAEKARNLYLKGKGMVLTNDLLLNLRAMSSQLKFDTYSLEAVSNGVGMDKISDWIKSNILLGTSETTILGYTKKESDKIKEGLRLLENPELLSGAPDGSYEVTQTRKTQREQMEAALRYLKTAMPDNMLRVLNAKSELYGVNYNKMLVDSLLQRETSVKDTKISAVTGKAAKNADGNSKSDDNDMIPAIAFFNGMGEHESFIIQDKTTDGLKINTISAPITSKGSNTGSITFDKLESSDFGGLLIMNLATMGDSLISPIGRNNIIIDGRIYQAELPIDLTAKANEGIIKPDLKFLKNIEVADAKLRQMGIDKSDPKNIPTINKVYLENNLPILYTIQGNKPVITSEYARFAIVNGVGTEDAFGENPELNNNMLREVSNSKERELFELLMQQSSGNNKYKLDNGYGIGPLSWGETKLYLGTIYIPMVSSNISALGGTGYKAKGNEYNEIERLQLEANAAREMGFKPAGDKSNIK